MRRLVAMGCALGLLCVVGSARAVEPGDYVTAGGWGRLSVTSPTSSGPHFDLQSQGANGHTCALAGTVEKDASAIAAGNGPACTVSFRATSRGLQVGSAGSQACRYFCGARAGFDGEYLRVSAACTPAAIAKTRAQFLDRYRTRRYRQATTTLKPLLAACAETLGDMASARIRNDLAIAYFHDGDTAACLDIVHDLLGPEAEARRQQAGPAPYDEQTWAAIVDAAKTNQRLCSTAKR